MVNQEELVHFFLLDTKEVCCLLLQLAELDVFRDRKLTGDRSVIWLLGAVDDYLLGGGNIGGDQDRGVNLKPEIKVISLINIAATVVKWDRVMYICSADFASIPTVRCCLNR